MPADANFARSQRFVRTDNKVNLGVDGSAFADYDATLAGVEYFYADERGRFADKAVATQQRVKLCWALDGSQIVLKDDIPVKFHGKSLYAARCREICGVRDEEAIEKVDLEQFIGFKGIVQTESSEKPAKADKPAYWWTNVKEVRSRERRVARPPGAQAAPAPAAAQHTAPPAAARPEAAPAQQPGLATLDHQLSLISLPAQRSIDALRDFKKMTAAQLRTLIGSMVGAHAALPPDRVEELKELMRAAVAA